MEKEKKETVMLQSNGRLGLIPSQIIYVEGYYEKSFNKFISENIIKIQDAFERKGYEFIYFPNIAPQLTNKYRFNELLNLVGYFFPSPSIKKIIESRIMSFIKPVDNRYREEFYSFFQFRIETFNKTKQLFSNFNYDKEIHPGFFRLLDNSPTNDVFEFEYYPIDLQSSFWSLFRKPDYWSDINCYIKRLSRDIDEIDECSSLCYSVSSDKVSMEVECSYYLPYPSRPHYYERKHDLLETIMTCIDEAKELGIYEELIREALEKLAHDPYNSLIKELKISRLVIDSEYRIFLPDYGNKEIRMATLPKSLFILFLKHPEGIILKQLSDYEPELMNIYKIISNRENITDMNDSIKRICTPFENSLNEKLSRIREAFVKNISEKYAEYYYVTGVKGETKQIKLDRRLVSMPEELSVT